ncbi:hypothetical protein FRC01_007786 [Tulasnella sp. 417]|nr:hypothetical protein FRC01_007786 [Tulasnella sp. 417]
MISSSFHRPGNGPRTGAERNDRTGQEHNLEDSQRRPDVESQACQTGPSSPPQTTPLPPSTPSAGVSQDDEPHRANETVEVGTNHDGPGGEHSTTRRTNGASSGHPAAIASASGSGTTEIEMRPVGSALPADRSRKHFHGFPVMPERPSMLGRHASLQAETEAPSPTLPIPPDATYSGPSSRIPAVFPVGSSEPPTAPPTGNPSPGAA